MAKRKRNTDEVSYWESMADGMVALLLLILLIMMLLILYLVRIPDDEFVDLYEGDRFEDYQDPEMGGGNRRNGELDDNPGDDWEVEDYVGGAGGQGGSGGNGIDGRDDGEGDFDDPDPGAGEGIGLDRAAVLVQVVDGETGRTIKMKGIEFELYSANSALKVLSTYYPKKIEYQKFQTDENGVFYLPEKVELESYFLHQLTTLPGYDMSENVAFSLDRSYDWPNPYVVTVSLFPAKNVIQIQLLDRGNSQPITGSSFDVLAAEDILTQDGTTRYRAGDVVDTIVLNEKGTGTSRELYLGRYNLRQNEVPELYARVTKEYVATIEERNSADSIPVTQIQAEKTTMSVQVSDALFDTTAIAGAKFTLTDDDGRVVERIVTDDKGRFSITDLKKNTTYHIQQDSTIGDYLMDQADHPFSVNADGLINDSAQGKMVIRNRMIRVSIGIQDKLFRGQVSDVNVALRDANGVVIKNWNTTGMEQIITGLVPGEYQVVISGNESSMHIIRVEEVTEIQVHQFDRWTTVDIGAIFGLGLIFAGMVAMGIFLLKRRKRNKKEKRGE